VLIRSSYGGVRENKTCLHSAALITLGATAPQSSAATKKATTKTVCKVVKGKKTCTKVKIKVKAKKSGDAIAGDAMEGTDAMSGDAMAKDTVPTATVKK
jgi:hypothetical protein